MGCPQLLHNPTFLSDGRTVTGRNNANKNRHFELSYAPKPLRYVPTLLLEPDGWNNLRENFETANSPTSSHVKRASNTYFVGRNVKGAPRRKDSVEEAWKSEERFFRLMCPLKHLLFEQKPVQCTEDAVIGTKGPTGERRRNARFMQSYIG